MRSIMVDKKKLFVPQVFIIRYHNEPCIVADYEYESVWRTLLKQSKCSIKQDLSFRQTDRVKRIPYLDLNEPGIMSRDTAHSIISYDFLWGFMFTFTLHSRHYHGLYGCYNRPDYFCTPMSFPLCFWYSLSHHSLCYD